MPPDAKDEAKRNGLAGLRVLCLESRRGQEMAKLIANYGGEAVVAPSMQEVTLKDDPEALSFARKLAEGGFDIVIFLTGWGRARWCGSWKLTICGRSLWRRSSA